MGDYSYHADTAWAPKFCTSRFEGVPEKTLCFLWQWEGVQNPQKRPDIIYGWPPTIHKFIEPIQISLWSFQACPTIHDERLRSRINLSFRYKMNLDALTEQIQQGYTRYFFRDTGMMEFLSYCKMLCRINSSLILRLHFSKSI